MMWVPLGLVLLDRVARDAFLREEVVRLGPHGGVDELLAVGLLARVRLGA